MSTEHEKEALQKFYDDLKLQLSGEQEQMQKQIEELQGQVSEKDTYIRQIDERIIVLQKELQRLEHKNNQLTMQNKSQLATLKKEKEDAKSL